MITNSIFSDLFSLFLTTRSRNSVFIIDEEDGELYCLPVTGSGLSQDIDLLLKEDPVSPGFARDHSKLSFRLLPSRVQITTVNSASSSSSSSDVFPH